MRGLMLAGAVGLCVSIAACSDPRRDAFNQECARSQLPPELTRFGKTPPAICGCVFDHVVRIGREQNVDLVRGYLAYFRHRPDSPTRISPQAVQDAGGMSVLMLAMGTAGTLILNCAAG